MTPSTPDPINSIIGESAHFNGEFNLEGSLRIDGSLAGRVISRGKIIVGPKGHVTTNIKANTVIVAGRVDGNIYALDTVTLLEDSVVHGDIIASNLVMEEGVIFDGRARIKTIENEESFFEN